MAINSKDQDEENAKDHFIAELRQQGRGVWKVIATDVEVDPATHINFDYQLESKGDLIALEVFRLVEPKTFEHRSADRQSRGLDRFLKTVLVLYNTY